MSISSSLTATLSAETAVSRSLSAPKSSRQSESRNAYLEASSSHDIGLHSDYGTAGVPSTANGYLSRRARLSDDNCRLATIVKVATKKLRLQPSVGIEVHDLPGSSSTYWATFETSDTAFMRSTGNHQMSGEHRNFSDGVLMTSRRSTGLTLGNYAFTLHITWAAHTLHSLYSSHPPHATSSAHSSTSCQRRSSEFESRS